MPTLPIRGIPTEMRRSLGVRAVGHKRCRHPRSQPLREGARYACTGPAARISWGTWLYFLAKLSANMAASLRARAA